MKRKLNEKDVPEAAPPSSKRKVAETDALETSTFADLGLDSRLLQAVSKQKYSTPTPVQAQAIPLAIAGRDVLARSKTGSGKTAAYTLPLLHRILKHKASAGATATTKLTGLVLVPTKELATQITKAIISYTVHCGKAIRTENVTRREDEKLLRARLAQAPDIVVATPAKARSLVEAGVLSLDGLLSCVIDEADLIFTYEREEDLQNLAALLPSSVQVSIMSATLKKEIEELKALFCKDPVVLELDQKVDQAGQLKQFVIKCAEDEKFLLIYAIFMLKLVKGKAIVFAADIDRAYRVKMYLEQFGIRSVVLNSELPANSRIHAVEEFNKGEYNILIASDENEVMESEQKSRKEKGMEERVEDTGIEENDADVTEVGDNAQLGDAPPKKKRRRKERDAEYGISRGIDFKKVDCVLNFDLPATSDSYTHRIGRTARAGRTGMAMSFCIPASQYRKHKPSTHPACAKDEETLAEIERSQEAKGQSLQYYDIDMKRLDGFRYRMADALRAVTRQAVREARAREIRNELLKSEKLKRHFEENPSDLAALRHDNETKAVRVQQHLKHVPEYLLPGGAKTLTAKGSNLHVGFAKVGENKIRAARKRNIARSKAKGGKKNKPRGDPLKSLGRR